MAEGFPTFNASIRLFFGVNPLLFYEKEILAEGSTLTTFIELLSCVAPLMLNEGSKLAFPYYFLIFVRVELWPKALPQSLHS